MSNQRFASVWDALEDTPEQAENLKLRAVLMRALQDHVTRSSMTHAQAAKCLGVTQQSIAYLMRGKLDLFTLDALVTMTASAGLQIELRVLDAA